MTVVDPQPTQATIKLQKIIRLLYWLIVPILLLAIILAWIFYPESYEFFNEYISNLGGYYSLNENLPNYTSSLILTIGFSMCGFIALVLAIIYFIFTNLRVNILKGILNLVLMMGAIGIAVPWDLPNIGVLHTIGSGLFVFGFSLINFAHQYLRFVRKHRPTPPDKNLDFYMDLWIMIIVFIVLFAFFIFMILVFLLKAPIFTVLAISVQKIMLIVDFLAIYFFDVDDM